MLVRLAFLLLLLVAAGACGDSAGDADLPADVDANASEAGDTSLIPRSPEFTVVSYNAGLAAGYVDYAPQRAPLIGPAVATLQADVVCLQEVWTDADAQTIIDATTAAFPHSYREATQNEAGTGEPACTVDELEPLKTCALAACPDIPPENLATCVLGACGDQFGLVSKECQGCLASQIGKPLDAMVTNCTTTGGATYTYDGRNGVLVLSRLPLLTTEMLRLDATMIARVVLHAVVQHDELGTVDVFCTHLTADFPDITYAGSAGSWGAEQAAQVDAMLSWAEEKRSSVVTVIAGDTNCGPAHGAGVVATFADTYAKFAAGGYRDPYAADDGTACTFCGDNPLVGGGDSWILDHVFVRGDFPASVSRVLDQPIEVQAEAPIETRLSDHFGVQVTVVVPLL